jgi:hypothetical protein
MVAYPAAAIKMEGCKPVSPYLDIEPLDEFNLLDLAGPNGYASFPGVPVISCLDPIIESRLRGAETSTQPRDAFPPENAGLQSRTAFHYSAALIRETLGEPTFFQSPGASTLLADNISIPTR